MIKFIVKETLLVPCWTMFIKPVHLTRQFLVSKDINEACHFEMKVWREKNCINC